MTPFLLLAQAAEQQHQGWLTGKLLNTLTGNAEWVLWILAVLSILSIAVMLERGIYFASHGLPDNEGVMLQLAKGDLGAVKTTVGDRQGMEASVLREGIAWSDKGPDSVQEIIDATMARERPRYERFLSILGTLGSNTPFIGLFGTVLGIIKAFHDLGQKRERRARTVQSNSDGRYLRSARRHCSRSGRRDPRCGWVQHSACAQVKNTDSSFEWRSVTRWSVICARRLQGNNPWPAQAERQR